MGSNLRCYQLKIDCYRYKSLSVRLTATTKQKPRINTQKRKRKEHKHTTKESHQTTKDEWTQCELQQRDRKCKKVPNNNHGEEEYNNQIKKIQYRGLRVGWMKQKSKSVS